MLGTNRQKASDNHQISIAVSLNSIHHLFRKATHAKPSSMNLTQHDLCTTVTKIKST